jgi:hypothetical protein
MTTPIAKIFILILLVAAIVLGIKSFPDTKIPIKDTTNPVVVNIPPVVTGDCYVGGCSAQICSDQKDVVSNCEFKNEYACYKTATCERQTNGQCGWTQTPALVSCLKNSPNGTISGHVTIGPNCPVERLDQPCPPPPSAYSSREAVIYAHNGSTIISKATINSLGNYEASLAPGSYFIQIVPAGIGPGEKKPFTVQSNATTTVNFDIDTGIR